MSVDQGLGQGFNDSELEDIMNEIESLEQDVPNVDEEDEGGIKEFDAEADLSQHNTHESKDATVAMNAMKGKDRIHASPKNDSNITPKDLKEKVEGDIAELERVDFSRSMKNQKRPVRDVPADVEDHWSPANAESENRWSSKLERKIGPAATEKTKEMRRSTAEAGTGQWPSQLDFTINGQMDLCLSFHFSEKKIHLRMDESNNFIIELDGGARFSFPLK